MPRTATAPHTPVPFGARHSLSLTSSCPTQWALVSRVGGWGTASGTTLRKAQLHPPISQVPAGGDQIGIRASLFALKSAPSCPLLAHVSRWMGHLWVCGPHLPALAAPQPQSVSRGHTVSTSQGAGDGTARAGLVWRWCVGAMCCIPRDAKNNGEPRAFPLTPCASRVTSSHPGLHGGLHSRSCDR